VLTTAEALGKILAAMPEFPAEAVEVTAVMGRILRQTVIAERDQPPFDRVMMDGIAIRHADYAKDLREFPVQYTQMAGAPASSLEPGHCIEIMTGAPLPKNADCIVPVERITLRGGTATLEDGYKATARQFIHPRASDHAAGTDLLVPGKCVSPLDIAVISSAGLTSVEATQAPTIRIISTGDELVPAGEPIEPHQIRMSNGPAIEAMLRKHGYADCSHDHLIDERDILRERIAAHVDAADVLILSGGVSMGKADYVPDVLAELGVEVIFHKVSQRPGKPMWFGIAPGNKAVFALPGNPVSALVCCRQYVIPALEKASLAAPRPPELASLASDVTFKPNLTCFQPVKLASNAVGQTIAIPVKTNTSGDFTALSDTDGYAELPLEETLFPAGTPVFIHRW
jgi:molybdopterin molybdotransferase